MKKSEFEQAVCLSTIYLHLRNSGETIEEAQNNKLIPEKLNEELEIVRKIILKACNDLNDFAYNFEKDNFDEKK
jgi:hypothetical protein